MLLVGLPVFAFHARGLVEVCLLTWCHERSLTAFTCCSKRPCAKHVKSRMFSGTAPASGRRRVRLGVLHESYMYMSV